MRSLPQILRDKRKTEHIVERFTLTLLFMKVLDDDNYVDWHIKCLRYWDARIRHSTEYYESLWKEREESEARRQQDR